MNNDYFGYEKKVCLITGISSGIGLQTAKTLLDLGAYVYGIDKKECPLDDVKKVVLMNLEDKHAINMGFKKLPAKIDCFFGCAGISGMKNTFNETFTINYISRAYILDEILPNRMENGGAITFVTSGAGQRWQDYRNSLDEMVTKKTWEERVQLLKHWNYDKLPGVMAYTLSNRAMNQHIAYHIMSFSEQNVRLNALLPSCTETGLSEEFQKAAGSPEKFLNYSGLSKRLATPSEMANPLIFLNSSMASFINGHELIVDYGNEELIKAGLKKDTYYQSNFYFRNFFVKAGLHLLKDRFSYPD